MNAETEKELRILIVEDNPADAELIGHQLRTGGFVFSSRIVDTREAFLKELGEFYPDIILSDYDLPSFDGLAALAITKEKCPDVPFVLVSGKLGEEFAIENLKKGATDYVLKNNLARLVPVLQRGLAEAADRAKLKQIERDLLFSEMRYRRLFETAKDGIMLIQAETGRIEDVNPFFMEMLGYSSEDCLGMQLWDIGSFKAVEKIKESFHELQKKEYVRYKEMPLVTKDGRNIHVEFVSNIYSVDNKKIIQYNIRDITERHEIEREFHRYAEEIEDLYNHTPCGYHSVDKNGIFARINNTELSWLGYSREEIVGKKKFADFLTDKSLETYWDNFALLKERKWVKDIEYDMLRHDGSIMTVLISATAVTDAAGDFVMSRSTLYDITEHKKMQKALLEAEEKYRVVFENTGTASAIFDEDMTILHINKECESLSGYSKEEIEGKKRWTDFVQKDDLLKMKEYHRMRRIDPHSAPRNYEFRLVDRQGQVKNIYLTIDLIPGTKKSVISLMDITEHQKMEEDLRQLMERYKVLADMLPQIIFEIDKDGKFTYANLVAFRQYGYTNEDLAKGLNALEIFIPEDRERVAKNIQRRLSGEEIGGVEYTAMRKDGTTVPVIIFASRIMKDNVPAGLRGIAIDITGRKQAEEALRTNEKELKKRIKELEEFYDVAVGRELRMMNLKQENEDLKLKLAKYEKL